MWHPTWTRQDRYNPIRGGDAQAPGFDPGRTESLAGSATGRVRDGALARPGEREAPA